MMAHEIPQNEDAAATASPTHNHIMAFDQSFDSSFDPSPFDQCFDQSFPATPTSGGPPASTMDRPAARLVSAPAPHDEHHYHPQLPPHLLAAPHCHSPTSSTEEEQSSITGELDDIERSYHVCPRVLGTGHTGSVRECVDRSTGCRYAVKTVSKSDPSVKPAGLAREILLLDEMDHPNVVRLVDVREDCEHVHLVTDLCEGGELFDRIVERSSPSPSPSQANNNINGGGVACFPEDEAAGVLLQILEAVAYMHRHDVAHRDIKPENILFTTSGEDSQVKIIDFGLSRKHFGGSGGEPPMTSVVGTPYYIAPEVLRKRYGKSCDLWSVGVIAYIMLCGYPPFNGDDADATHRAVLKRRLCFPAEEWGNISTEARDFVHRLLQKDPRRRMTAEQALNHPWMVKHSIGKASMGGEEELLDNSSVEVLYTPRCEAPRKHPASRVGGESPPRNKRKVRMSMFGL